MWNILKKIFGDPYQRKLKEYQPIVDIINSLEPEIQKMSQKDILDKTNEFKKRISDGEDIDSILPEAFAIVREASKRTLNMRPFDVQLIGGIVLHQGKISEMKTGEGKTLVATMPVYLNSLTGKGVHVVTVNDYLARRDATWMGKVYEYLGLSVGLIQSQMNYRERKIGYSRDVTYGTNNEFGFDYLRDNMALNLDQTVQRKLNYAIVDEVDSILIDEARTPLIISGMVEDSTDKYRQLARLAKKLAPQTDYTTDEKHKNVVLTEEGLARVEKELGIDNIYDVAHMDIAHILVQCLRAYKLFKRDVDYVIKDNEILIVDEFTGRLMIGRRFSDGLHQAIEAVENVPIKEESQTLASITFQNYFRMYKKLAGMTGTALTEEAEFGKIYNLEVIPIPPNMPMIRMDNPDIVYKSKEEKYKAIINEVVEKYKIGQPVLLGTIAIETSELLSDMLRRKGVAHSVLNAKYHEKEAEIIAKAGQKKNVTIATNMAGRGTDIVLGEGVVDLGGLHVMGSERHESRRIDNQLRGRSGRQGDPGSSRFYVGLDDDLMRLFGSDRIAKIMDTLRLPSDTPIEHPWISSSIERAQKKVEQYHFSIRKQVLEYDDVINKQRDTIYALRRKILEGEDISTKIKEMLEKVTNKIIDDIISDNEDKENWAIDELTINIENILPLKGIKNLLIKFSKKEVLKEEILNISQRLYNERHDNLGEDMFNELQRQVLLRQIDLKWIDHLHDMDNLREGIGLRAYGQMDPLLEYKVEAFEMFKLMMSSIEEETISMLFKAQVIAEEELEPVAKATSYSGGDLSPRSITQNQNKAHEKIGRNDPCPCGSGKKYKKCCMR